MKNVKKISLVGLLGALALVLAFVEGLLPPLPMMPPGAKPGLSNVVTMFAAGAVGLPSALFIALIKAVFAFCTRGAVAGSMSLLGGIISTFAAWLLLKKTDLSYVTVGVICAVLHNLAQLTVAFFITGTGILYYIPMLMVFGVCTGILTGLLLRLVYQRLGKIFRKDEFV